MTDFSATVFVILDVILFVVCALLVGVLINRYREMQFEKNDFGDESGKASAELLHQESYWVCSSCNAEFRLLSGEKPQICPSCGDPLVIAPAGIDDDAAPYICSHCGPYILLDGDDSDICPVCGSKDVKIASLAVRRTEHWVCSKCSQEFVSPSLPKQCPYCESVFSKTDGELDDESSVFKCPACGKETEMMDGDEMEYCSHCGTTIETDG